MLNSVTNLSISLQNPKPIIGKSTPQGMDLSFKTHPHTIPASRLFVHFHTTNHISLTLTSPIRENSLDLWSEFAMSFFLWRHLA